jgi:XTP/dITP diphosphohydrolase
VKSRPIVLATRSSGKLRELRLLFDGAGIPVIDLDEAGITQSSDEDEIETFDTFEENALAKARYYGRKARGAVVADDSGLEVTALGGRPGVRSKRWSGRDDLSGAALDDANNRQLLEALHAVSDRRAQYVCVAAYLEEATERTFRGITAGRILEAAHGTGGFGYDPYFFSDELGQSFGEATVDQKEGVSHRGRAFRALIKWLSRG